ncbi:MAG TPA: OPT/YSL family transporter, partial [Phycisphaerae bacterium]|nr:OPT/YSL family transporter [Phycisphaerae bacterium]
LPAKLLVIFSALAAGIKLLQSSKILTKIHLGILHIPEMLDEWYYTWAERAHHYIPTLSRVPLRELTVRPELDIAMIGAGGLMGIRTGVSLMIGAVLNYVVIVPWIISRGDIHPVADEATLAAWTQAVIATVTGAKAPATAAFSAGDFYHYGFKPITTWALWSGVTMMTTASLVAFFSKPATLLKPLKGLFQKHERTEDCLKSVELPLWVSVVGVPIIGAGLVYMAWAFYGVPVWMSSIAVPMVFIFTLIAVNSTALTSITPTGAMGKITQLTYGAIAPGQIRTNIVTACISAEVSSSASNLIQNIKPGYMLGGKPRLQAIGHVIGGVAGSLASVAVFYALFLRNSPSTLITPEYPYPAATAWKAVAEILTKGIGQLPVSAQWSVLIGGVAGIVLEIIRIASKGKFPISPVGIGLAFIIPFTTCLAMFAGSFMFWVIGRLYPRPEQKPNTIFVQNQESICAGIIAGAALMGVAVMAIELFLLK